MKRGMQGGCTAGSEAQHRLVGRSSSSIEVCESTDMFISILALWRKKAVTRQDRQPAAPARVVVTAERLTTDAFIAVWMSSWEPGLKPYLHRGGGSSKTC